MTAVVFVIQHLFDEAQITADNVGAPVHRDQWQYIHNIGLDMRNTLANVSYVLAPLFSHAVTCGFRFDSPKIL